MPTSPLQLHTSDDETAKAVTGFAAQIARMSGHLAKGLLENAPVGLTDAQVATALLTGFRAQYLNMTRDHTPRSLRTIDWNAKLMVGLVTEEQFLEAAKEIVGTEGEA